MPEPIAWLRVLEDGTLQSKQPDQDWRECKPSDLPQFREALVGRCATCRFWDATHLQSDGYGTCDQIVAGVPWSGSHLATIADGSGDLWTQPDFGCVQWEAGDE